jgi:hypothetical protein
MTRSCASSVRLYGFATRMFTGFGVGLAAVDDGDGLVVTLPPPQFARSSAATTRLLVDRKNATRRTLADVQLARQVLSPLSAPVSASFDV